MTYRFFLLTITNLPDNKECMIIRRFMANSTTFAKRLDVPLAAPDPSFKTFQHLSFDLNCNLILKIKIKYIQFPSNFRISDFFHSSAILFTSHHQATSHNQAEGLTAHRHLQYLNSLF